MTNSLVLPESTGLAFIGEAAWIPAVLTPREAKILATATNACGRPNSDVLRRRLAVVNGEPAGSWQIDFPDHFTAQEAALYEQPFTLLSERAGGTWQNPRANPALRRALARVSRYLATPVDSVHRAWRWIEEDSLPDATLLVITRDDDFTHGVLQSHPFNVWWRKLPSARTPDSIVGSFPFPWPPATPLSALSAAQEEQRHAIARATRSGDIDSLNAAVLSAYGWTADLADSGLLEKLTALNRINRGPIS